MDTETACIPGQVDNSYNLLKGRLDNIHFEKCRLQIPFNLATPGLEIYPTYKEGLYSTVFSSKRVE